MPILILVMALVAGAVVWSLPTIGQTDDELAEQACDVTEVDREVTLFRGEHRQVARRLRDCREVRLRFPVRQWR